MQKHKDKFSHKISNRNNKLKYAETIRKIVSRHDKIDCIIDFCAENINDISCVLKGIEGSHKVSQYIFISSHAVYDVCSAIDGLEFDTSGGVEEDLTDHIGDIHLLPNVNLDKLKKMD